MPAAIEAEQLRKHYPPDVQALDGVDLNVEAGTIFGVLGPNGAGKSTLTRVLCTLTRPDEGTAMVAGIDALAHPVRVRRAIGVVGQKHGADPSATGRENLILQGEFHGITGSDLKEPLGRSSVSSSRMPPIGWSEPTRGGWRDVSTSPWAS
jgi:ABC-2 type transport system ATP-binding protein